MGIIQSCRLAIAKHDRLCCCALAGRGWLGLVCWWSPIMADCRRQRSASTADLVSQLISWCDFWTTCMAAVSWSVVLPHVGINFIQSVPSADGIQCKPVSFIDGRACVCHGCVCVCVCGWGAFCCPQPCHSKEGARTSSCLTNVPGICVQSCIIEYMAWQQLVINLRCMSYVLFQTCAEQHAMALENLSRSI